MRRRRAAYTYSTRRTTRSSLLSASSDAEREDMHALAETIARLLARKPRQG